MKTGFPQFFLKSDEEVSISGLSHFQSGILEWLTSLTISKGILESSILKPIDLILFYGINFQILVEKHSQKEDYRYLLLVSQFTAV